MWVVKVVLLLMASNVIILLVNILKANFVDTVNFSLRNLLDPLFWLKNPALMLILSLCIVWFFSTILASQSASLASDTKLTATIYTVVSLAVAASFMLINLMTYQALRKEAINPTMWIWASLATLFVVLSCVALYLFMTEGQKVISS